MKLETIKEKRQREMHLHLIAARQRQIRNHIERFYNDASTNDYIHHPYGGNASNVCF